jgi:hypothetical protein
LKGSSTKKFNNIVEYTKHDIESCLVEYVNKNEDIEIMLQQISIDYREIEGTLFDIKVKQEVIVSPLCDYIEKWLSLSLIKVTKENQEEEVGIGEETIARQDIRATTSQK